jgi:hypothetical protein
MVTAAVRGASCHASGNSLHAEIAIDAPAMAQRNIEQDHTAPGWPIGRVHGANRATSPWPGRAVTSLRRGWSTQGALKDLVVQQSESHRAP